MQAVQKGSPAAAAGIQGGSATVSMNGQRIQAGGDIITAIDGTAVHGMDDVVNAIATKKPGDKVTLDLAHGSSTRTVTVTLGNRPEHSTPRANPSFQLTLQVRPGVPPKRRDSGTFVVGCDSAPPIVAVMRVKFCGITRLEDAEEAARLGAWAIGLNHWEGGPRRVRPDAAVEIGSALRRRLEVVGVFVNAPIDEIVRAAQDESLTLIQLHGGRGSRFLS